LREQAQVRVNAERERFFSQRGGNERCRERYCGVLPEAHLKSKVFLRAA
jgi:hypothetical protein